MNIIGYNSNLTVGRWCSPQGGIVFIGPMNMCFVREDNGHPFHTAPFLQYIKPNDGRPEKKQANVSRMEGLLGTSISTNPWAVQCHVHFTKVEESSVWGLGKLWKT